jgi:glutathione-regulated potassium-efflux system ancillary protein KefG
MDDELKQSVTQILLFHPDSERSRANTALVRAAVGLHNVAIADMAALYPAGIAIEHDSAREAARLLRADRIVLQFPMQWYSTPALLKQWQDVVLTRMAYMNWDTEGAGLAGKPVMVAATMGAEEATYRPEGRNRFTVAELLAPLQASANRLEMDWRHPFLMFGADALHADNLAEAGHAYTHALSRFAAPASGARPYGSGSDRSGESYAA